MNNTIGVFHRVPTQVQFDPAAIANKIKCHREFYSNLPHDVRAFAYSGTEATGSPVYARNDIDKFIADGGTNGFDPHFRHVVGGHAKKGKACGQAIFGGHESCSFDEFGCDSGDDTSIHELTHNGLGDGTPSWTGTGIGHSHSQRGKEIDQMGDWSSLMGAGPGEGLLSAHICCLGWNRPEETIVFDMSGFEAYSGQVLIAPVEMSGLHSGKEFKHVIIRGKPDMYLSTRLDYPFSLGERGAPRERLYLHEFYPHGHPSIPGDFPNTTLRLPDLMPGEAMHGSVTVRYIAWDEGIATVEITMTEEQPNE